MLCRVQCIVCAACRSYDLISDRPSEQKIAGVDYTPANITQVWLFHLLVRHTVLFQNDVMCDGSIHYKEQYTNR